MIRKRSLLIGASAVAALVVSAVPASAHVSPTTYGTTYTAGVTNVFALRVPDWWARSRHRELPRRHVAHLQARRDGCRPR